MTNVKFLVLFIRYSTIFGIKVWKTPKTICKTLMKLIISYHQCGYFCIKP